MKALDRSLIEKAGYDNGFEIVTESVSSVVSLCSSIHPIRVDIIDGSHAGAYILQFSEFLSLAELKRGLNKKLFLDDGIEVWNRELLGAVLKRAAELGIALPDGPIKLYNERLDEYGISHDTIGSMFQGTEREQLIKQRIGQGVYREALFKYWKGSCAVTTIDIPELLRASHIKPWADCDNDSDRLNVYNGFLLSANYDALFDKGLITFDDDGSIIYSDKINKSHIHCMGAEQFRELRWIDERHLPYLEWHRKYVYNGT